MTRLLRILTALLALCVLAALPVRAQQVLGPVHWDSLDATCKAFANNNQNRANRTRCINQVARFRLLPVALPPQPPLDTSAVRVEVSPSSGPSVVVGDTVRFTAAVFDSSGVRRAWAVTWSSDSVRVATVSTQGLARGLAPGRSNITARTANNVASNPVPLEVRQPPVTQPPSEWSVVWADTIVNGNLRCPIGSRCLIGRNVRVAGNVLAESAVVGMRPGSSLTFLGADPAAYVGGGLEYSPAVDSDRGLWVWGTGSLDFACSPKVAWNRTGSDASWLSGDELWIAPTAAGDYAPRRYALGQPVPNVGGGMPSAEVVNVSRDCTVTGPAHIHVHSSRAQRIEYVTLRSMGVSVNGEPVLGRYALHFHMSGEGTRGSIIRGVACVDSGGKCFAPHNSHGVTMTDDVCVNALAECFWWDAASESNDILVDRLGALGIGRPQRFSAVVLDAGTGNEVRNSFCAAAGSCWVWPEPGPEYGNVLTKLVWKFDTGNVGHNNFDSGLFFWNNEQAPQTHSHIVANYTSYRNAIGINNGAYTNCNQYRNVTQFEDGIGQWMGPFNFPGVHWNNNSGLCTGGRTARYEDSRIHSRDGPAIIIDHRQVGAGAHMVWEDNVLIAGPGQPKVLVFAAIPESNPWKAHFIRSGVRPEDIVFESCAGNNEGSEALIDGVEGRWSVRCENGQKVVRTLTAPPSGEAAELPRVRVNTAMPATTRTVRVPATGNLQTSLNAAASGDLLLLPAGATYTGNFTLPVKSGSGWVVVQTETALPPEGTRATAQTAANYAKILTPNPDPAVATIGAARRYRFVGVEVGIAAGVSEVFSLIRLGDGTENTLAQVPGDIIFDRVYAHGRAGTNLQRCFALNAAALAVVESHVSECHYSGADSQAAAAWNTPGPILLRNNYLEGAGENVMFGGADSRSPEMIPADIEVVGNTIAKPAAWFTSRQWTVKNLLEIKTATRVQIEGNTLDGSWRDGQTGHGFQLFSVNQDENSPWSYTSDITIRKNVIRNVAAGFTLSARYGTVAAPLSRVLIEDNRFENVGTASPYTSADESRYLFGLLDDLGPMSIRHNTSAGLGLSNQVVFEGSVTRLVFENNVIGPAEYGFQNAASLGTMAPGAIVRGNVLAPATWNDQLPAGNCIVWPPSLATACPGAGVREP